MAIVNTVLSMPARGSITKPAASDPIAAPIVLTSVRTPAVWISDLNSLRSATPTIGKNIPETNETGSISGRLMRTIASGCVTDVRPNGSITRGKYAYEATVATAATNASVAAKRGAVGIRRISRDVASPPSAMPARTTPSITGNARELPLTKRRRNRNQTTSSASRQNPPRNAENRYGVGVR